MKRDYTFLSISTRKPSRLDGWTHHFCASIRTHVRTYKSEREKEKFGKTIINSIPTACVQCTYSQQLDAYSQSRWKCGNNKIIFLDRVGNTHTHTPVLHGSWAQTHTETRRTAGKEQPMRVHVYSRCWWFRGARYKTFLAYEYIRRGEQKMRRKKQRFGAIRQCHFRCER